MPSLPALLSPTSSDPRPYSPLHNPDDGGSDTSPRPAPAKRIASSSSAGSSDEESREAQSPSLMTGYTSITRATTLASEETLAARTSTMTGENGEVEGDIGEIRNGNGVGYGYHGGKLDVKGKGKERAWDVEQGKVEEMYGGDGEYPPTNEELEAERRIQENLARMAARDQARKRASRQSKMLVPTASPDLGTEGYSSSTAYGRPMSMNGSVSSKRSSFMGIVDGLWGGGGANRNGGMGMGMGGMPIEEEREPPFIPPDMGRDSTQLMANPYATRPAPISPPLNHTPPPGLIISPASPDVNTHGNPFDDPSTPRGVTTIKTGPSPAPATGNGHQRTDSTASTITPASPTSPTETMRYGYAGPGWRGGAAGANGTVQNVEKPEKWWHAFCAWGRDLDGDDEDGDNQAGRTNPFE